MITCNCGGKEFSFIGVQTLQKTPYFLKLYSCHSCRTTISTKVVEKQHVPTRAVADSVTMHDRAVRSMPQRQILDAVGYMPV